MLLSNEEALRMINALRSGTSPINYSETILSGRDAEMDSFKHALHLLGKGAGMVKLITGPFGVGKSLLVNTYKQAAINEDFIIASFQVNNGFRLNKIEDLYYAIMHNLYLKSKPYMKVSFEDIFDLWIENLQNAPFSDRKRFEVNTVCQELSKYNMNYARAFLSFMRGRIQRNQEMTNVSCAWLTGEKNIPYELKQKYELVGAVDKTNTMDFLRAFIKLITLLDYKGLVVFIDEIDQVTGERSDLRQVGYNNLKHLIDLSTSGEMKHVMFVFSGSENILQDREKGILSNVPLSQRLNLHPDQPLSGNENLILLDTLGSEAFLELTEKIIRLYQQCYRLNTPIDALSLFNEIIASFDPTRDVTRHFVTRLIEKLDRLKI